MSVIPNVEIPQDVWRHIGSFLSLKDLSPLFHTCKTLKSMSRSIFESLARFEQHRMAIPFQGVRLTLDCVTKHRRQLDPKLCKELDISLKEQPLMLYSDLEAATVLLREDVVACRDDDWGLLDLANVESNYQKAVIIAESMPDIELKQLAFLDISKRISKNPEVDEKEILRIAEKIPDPFSRSVFLFSIIRRSQRPAKEKASLAEKIPDPNVRGAINRSIFREKYGIIMKNVIPSSIVLTFLESAAYVLVAGGNGTLPVKGFYGCCLTGGLCLAATAVNALGIRVIPYLFS